jgi:hypothetical protein
MSDFEGYRLKELDTVLLYEGNSTITCGQIISVNR